MKVKALAALIALFITLPIAFYLQYKILQLVGASEVMWLLFWVNLPLTLFLHLLVKLADD